MEEGVKRPLRLVSDFRHEMVGGVCAGLAYYFGVQTWLVRAITLTLIFSTGFAFFVYLVLWFLIPNWEETPDDFLLVTGD